MNQFQPSHYSARPSPDVSLFANSGANVSAMEDAAPPAAREEHPSASRILVVEDDEDVCETIGRLLRQAGYRVDSACDGEAGWDALLKYRFSLLVTDNRMPRLTGVELIGRLRAAGSTLPAILASGTLPWDEAEAPSALRPLATIEKPFSGYELLAKVREALRFLTPSSLGEARREGPADSSDRKWWNGRSSPQEASLAGGRSRI